jgi:NAD-dependent deacetylase
MNPGDYKKIVFFTGAGMSAESGVPTYRGSGGIWHKYNYEEYACQDAFDANPEKVLKFHELRRKSVLECQPHAGHHVISRLQSQYSHISIVTQNIDGMHQRAGSKNVIELHGSLWRVRCTTHGTREDIGETFKTLKCEKCGEWLRPDIVWFGDMLDQDVIAKAATEIETCDLFISIGTSGVVYPAAGFPGIAKRNGALCIEINPEPNAMSNIYDRAIREPAGKALQELFPA